MCVTNYSSETTNGGKVCKFTGVFCKHPLRGTYTKCHKHIIGLPRFENLPLQTKSVHSCCSLLWTLDQHSSDKYTSQYYTCQQTKCKKIYSVPNKSQSFSIRCPIYTHHILFFQSFGFFLSLFWNGWKSNNSPA